MSKKAMKKEIKDLKEQLRKAINRIVELNEDLDRHKAIEKQSFTNWKIDSDMTELISGLTHERQLMADAVRDLGLRMGSVSTFLEAVRQRVPKAGEVIDYTQETIKNEPKRKLLNNVQ